MRPSRQECFPASFSDPLSSRPCRSPILPVFTSAEEQDLDFNLPRSKRFTQRIPHAFAIKIMLFLPYGSTNVFSIADSGKWTQKRFRRLFLAKVDHGEHRFKWWRRVGMFWKDWLIQWPIRLRAASKVKSALLIRSTASPSTARIFSISAGNLWAICDGTEITPFTSP